MAYDIILPPESKAIPLTRGHHAIVDSSLHEMLSCIKWHLGNRGKRLYAYRCVDRHTLQGMHRFIMNASSEFVVDHSNGDTLDNRTSNLRVCTTSQNNMNRRIIKSQKNTSKFKGVSLTSEKDAWEARIKINGKSKYLGRFKEELPAALAYDDAAKRLFVDFAHINFPDAITERLKS